MFKQKSLPVVICTIMLLTVACSSQPSTSLKLPEYWPTKGWQLDSPSNRGFDAVKVGDIASMASNEVPFLDSIIIIRNGFIVYEEYFNGYDSTKTHDIASVTKSWTSAAVGIAQAQGKLPNLDAQLPTLLPDYFSAGEHADKREITLRHLLMMRSGIDWDEEILDTSGYGTGEDLLGTDLTEFGLSFPMAHKPGETWNYSSLDTQLISAIVQHSVGRSLESFTAANLFEQMGISEFNWLADSTGTTIGGQNLHLRPRDMAKLGLLYLQDGIWDGQQLVPSEWIRQSLTPQAGEAYYAPSGQIQEIEWYGYLWWTWKPDWFFGYHAFQAQGYAGQQVLVLPDLDLIIVTTANLSNVNPFTAGEQEEAVYSFLLERIFPALTDVHLTEK
jgi:CubicO group peptidase (beta-lactamase class C family)